MGRPSAWSSEKMVPPISNSASLALGGPGLELTHPLASATITVHYPGPDIRAQMSSHKIKELKLEEAKQQLLKAAEGSSKKALRKEANEWIKDLTRLVSSQADCLAHAHVAEECDPQRRGRDEW